MIQEISNPKYLTSEKVEQLQSKKLIDSLFDLPVLFRKLENAERELFFNYENYVERGMENATYNVASFDQVDIGRMGVEALPNSDWYYEEIDEQAEKIIDILRKNFPTKFHKPYDYLITWEEGILVFQVSLGEEERQELASDRGIDLKELNKMKKNNPNYLKKRFDLLDKVKELVDKGYEVYSDDYRNHYNKNNLQKALLNPEAFITSQLFRYTDYGGGYTIAKANIKYIEENFKKLIEDGVISSYSTRHNGENMEFKFRALENDELYEILLSLYDYPVIDDQTLSEVESELEQECWESYGREDFWKALIKKYGEEAEELKQEQVDSLAYEAAQYTCCGMGEVENMQFNFYIKDLIDAVSKLEEGKKLVKKENPIPKCENPSWAKDEDIWEKAKKQSLKSYGRISYPFVVYLYKQMGGKIKKKIK